MKVKIKMDMPESCSACPFKRLGPSDDMVGCMFDPGLGMKTYLNFRHPSCPLEDDYKLKPCPACGAPAKIWHSGGSFVYWAGCTKCGLQTHGFYLEETVAKAWNDANPKELFWESKDE